MKLILSLLKKILVSLSDFYRKDYVNAELDKRVDSTVFTSSLGDETAERKRVDLEISASIDDNEANDESLAKVIEWQGYVDQICRSVDDDVAIAFAEEFEKATVEYLKDPTVSKVWKVTRDSEGVYTSTSPYSEGVPVSVLVDFSKISANGYYLDSTNKKDVFNIDACNIVFFPNASSISNGSLYRSFTGVIFLPELTYGFRLFQGGNSNPIIFAPKLINASQLCRNLSKFNNRLYLPVAVECSYMLQTDTSYNQPLDLPNAKTCDAMLSGCSKFNFPINFPKAEICDNMLLGAKSFNSTIDLPLMVRGNYLLKGAVLFNQPINFPEALYCSQILNGASSFNQVAVLPKCSSLSGAFANTAMSAENISKTLDTLPEWDSSKGGTGVITFTGCPGAAELTQDSPSVAAAVAKGWTVEL